MKILFLVSNDSKALYPNLYGAGGSSSASNSQESNDYLTDAIFQYCKTNTEIDVYECPWMVHMYKNSPSKKEELSGYGFALRKDLEQSPNILDINEAISRIQSKYFDYIITDSRSTNPWWQDRGLSPFRDEIVRAIGVAFEIYPSNRIIFFDGEDQTGVFGNILENVTYFKRELQFDHSRVHPIGYCFPEHKFKNCEADQKQKDIATIIPGDKSTYLFEEEEPYYEDYRISRYGYTWKKLGWDCFRHHELLFSSCVPIFPDIRECPTQTLTRFPKHICEEVLNSGLLVEGTKYQQYHDLYCFTNLKLDVEKISKDHYADILGRLKEHALKYLTSKSVFEYIMSITDR
jgi:hypothetical protein